MDRLLEMSRKSCIPISSRRNLQQESRLKLPKTVFVLWTNMPRQAWARSQLPKRAGRVSCWYPGWPRFLTEPTSLLEACLAQSKRYPSLRCWTKLVPRVLLAKWLWHGHSRLLCYKMQQLDLSVLKAKGPRYRQLWSAYSNKVVSVVFAFVARKHWHTKFCPEAF